MQSKAPNSPRYLASPCLFCSALNFGNINPLIDLMDPIDMIDPHDVTACARHW